MGSVTQLLKRWQQGDSAAQEELFALVYQDLKKSAVGMLRNQWSQPRLQPTELTNEAYIKLAALEHLDWQNKAHFLAIAATVMRQVLLDSYRRERADKRAHERVTIVTEHLVGKRAEYELAELDDGIKELAQVSEELAQIVEMKFFAGMTHEEIGVVLGTSATTVKRNWRAARAWLRDYLAENNEPN